MESNSTNPEFINYIEIALVIIIVVSLWKTFIKAGKPGWYSIIPIYNYYILLKIVGRPGWWTILYFIPILSLVINIIVALDLAKSFRKNNVFGIFGLVLFPFIGWPILGFGNSKYFGPSRKNRTTET